MDKQEHDAQLEVAVHDHCASEIIDISVLLNVQRFYTAQNELIRKVYILHGLLEIIIGVSIASLSYVTESTLEFQTPATCITLLVLYAITSITAFKSFYVPAIRENSTLFVIALSEFVVGLSLFCISLEMFVPIIFQFERFTPQIHMSNYVWFSGYMGATSAFLLAMNPSVTSKKCTCLQMVLMTAAQLVLVDCFPFSWMQLPQHAPIIYGAIALTNNIGVIFIVKKYSSVLPKLMDKVGMRMELENSEKIVLPPCSVSWEEVMNAYVPVMFNEVEDSV
ncbi:hypothetical protein HDU79_008558 [Rhizoclosmatium sp. JEL0117]|nr:hypothetical protein HDU79_008558 [Rhizoclosmatium sp. JEL0117]